jgi:hypothetical protein
MEKTELDDPPNDVITARGQRNSESDSDAGRLRIQKSTFERLFIGKI